MPPSPERRPRSRGPASGESVAIAGQRIGAVTVGAGQRLDCCEICPVVLGGRDNRDLQFVNSMGGRRIWRRAEAGVELHTELRRAEKAFSPVPECAGDSAGQTVRRAIAGGRQLQCRRNGSLLCCFARSRAAARRRPPDPLKIASWYRGYRRALHRVSAAAHPIPRSPRHRGNAWRRDRRIVSPRAPGEKQAASGTRSLAGRRGGDFTGALSGVDRDLWARDTCEETNSHRSHRDKVSNVIGLGN